MKKLSILLVVLAFISCSNSSMSSEDFGFAEKAMSAEASQMEYDIEEQASSYSNEASSGQRQKEANIERKIIRTANLSMQVKNVEKSTAVIEQLIKQKGGFISSVNLSSSGSYINNSITIRIPNEKLDTLLGVIGQEAIHIDRKSINAQDVTEEFVDIQIRLKTKKDVRDRYVEVLRKKASTVEEILNAEERIRIIQEEIESKEGRLRFLSNQVSLSTIHLNIYQNDGKGLVSKSYGSKLGQAFFNGWENIKGFIIAIVNIWPFWILIGILFYFGRNWRFFPKRKK